MCDQLKEARHLLTHCWDTAIFTMPDIWSSQVAHPYRAPANKRALGDVSMRKGHLKQAHFYFFNAKDSLKHLHSLCSTDNVCFPCVWFLYPCSFFFFNNLCSLHSSLHFFPQQQETKQQIKTKNKSCSAYGYILFPMCFLNKTCFWDQLRVTVRHCSILTIMWTLKWF